MSDDDKSNGGVVGGLVEGLLSLSPGGTVLNATGATDTVTNALPDALTNFVPEFLLTKGFWIRVLVGLAGLQLIWLGVIIIIAGSDVGKRAIGLGVSAASKGVVPPSVTEGMK